MGGYVIPVKEDGGHAIPTRWIRLTLTDFRKFAKRQSLELPAKTELMDRSKGDWISKSIALIQIFWFLSQLIGRAAQELPVTSLELFTCAIMMCTAATYFTWWDQPLDVQRPIVLDCELPAAFLIEHEIVPLQRFISFLDNWEEGDAWSKLRSSLSTFMIILVFAAPNLVGWNLHFPTWTEQLLWGVVSILCTRLPAAVLFSTPLFDDSGQGSWEPLALFSCAYMLVHAYLLIEVFVRLRSVPAEVYTAVNWSA